MEDNKDFEISEDVLKMMQEAHREPTQEELEIQRQESEKELKAKGFLPKNPELKETPSSPQEIVEANPRQFIIEECIPACQELWSKNIYTFMVSDHLNEGQCWIEVVLDSLSDENKEILYQLEGEDVIKYSYHKDCANFGVKHVGLEGQQRLLELAQEFKMQDVPKNQAWLSEEEFLMRYCNCYEEYDNPNYKPMISPWEADIDRDNLLEYIKKYDEWESSEESREILRRFDPGKMTKSVSEYADEHGMIYEDGRVYLSNFHYQKHLNYVQYIKEQKHL